MVALVMLIEYTPHSRVSGLNLWTSLALSKGLRQLCQPFSRLNWIAELFLAAVESLAKKVLYHVYHHKISTNVLFLVLQAYFSTIISYLYFRLNTPRDIPSRGILRLGSKYHYKGRTQKQAIEDYNNLVRTNSNFERTPSKRMSRRKIASPTNDNHNSSKTNNNNRNFYLNNNSNSNSTPVKSNYDNENLDFVSPLVK